MNALRLRAEVAWRADRTTRRDVNNGPRSVRRRRGTDVPPRYPRAACARRPARHRRPRRHPRIFGGLHRCRSVLRDQRLRHHTARPPRSRKGRPHRIERFLRTAGSPHRPSGDRDARRHHPRRLGHLGLAPQPQPAGRRALGVSFLGEFPTDRDGEQLLRPGDLSLTHHAVLVARSRGAVLPVLSADRLSHRPLHATHATRDDARRDADGGRRPLGVVVDQYLGDGGGHHLLLAADSAFGSSDSAVSSRR